MNGSKYIGDFDSFDIAAWVDKTAREIERSRNKERVLRRVYSRRVDNRKIALAILGVLL